MQLQHGLHALDLVKLYSAGYILGAKKLVNFAYDIKQRGKKC